MSLQTLVHRLDLVNQGNNLGHGAVVAMPYRSTPQPPIFMSDLCRNLRQAATSPEKLRRTAFWGDVQMETAAQHEFLQRLGI